jgi:hypothetical protein
MYIRIGLPKLTRWGDDAFVRFGTPMPDLAIRWLDLKYCASSIRSRPQRVTPLGRLWPKCIDPIEQASTIVVQAARPHRSGDPLRCIVEPRSSN